MTTIQIDQTQRHPQNNSPIQLKPSCVICCERRAARSFFAHCSHFGNCVLCAQNRMLQQIKVLKFPTCFVEQGCLAKMRIDNGSNFEYFSPQSKKQWQIYLQKTQLESMQIQLSLSQQKKPCQKQNCPGIIRFHQCSKCLTFYCEKCDNLDHEIDVGCHKSDILLPNGIKIQYCPKCQQPFSKSQGCNHIVCGNKNCRLEFCEICREIWSFSHHTCKEVRTTQETNTSSEPNQTVENKKSIECCQIF